MTNPNDLIRRGDAILAAINSPHQMDAAERINRLPSHDVSALVEVAGLVEALRDISRQKKTDDLDTEHDVEFADFEGGYDACIDRARAALAAWGGRG